MLKRLVNVFANWTHSRRLLDCFLYWLSKVNPAPVPITTLGITSWIDREEIRWMVRRQCEIDKHAAPFPSHTKAFVIAYYQQKTNARYFVETGTNTGHTLAAVAPLFVHSYSIEINGDLVNIAKQRLRQLNIADQVTILHGKSRDELAPILCKVGGDAILWIDAHELNDPVNGNPWQYELKAIQWHIERGYRPIILIDDAGTWVTLSDKELIWFEEHGYTLTKRPQTDIYELIPEQFMLKELK